MDVYTRRGTFECVFSFITTEGSSVAFAIGFMHLAFSVVSEGGREGNLDKYSTAFWIRAIDLRFCGRFVFATLIYAAPSFPHGISVTVFAQGSFFQNVVQQTQFAEYQQHVATAWV